MRRGRWVGAFIAIFILTTNYQLLTTSSYAASLSMSATVPLSSLWKVTLREESQVILDTTHPSLLLVSQESRGIESIPVENQIIHFLVLRNGKMVFQQIKKTNKKGVANFVFVSETYGEYSILVINKSDSHPFVVKNFSISL